MGVLNSTFYPNENFVRQLTEVSNDTQNVIVKNHTGINTLHQTSSKETKTAKKKVKGFLETKSNYSEEQLTKKLKFM